ENIEDDCHRQERDDEAEQRMHHVHVDNHQRGGNNGNSRSYVEGDRHGVLKRLSFPRRLRACGSEKGRSWEQPAWVGWRLFALGVALVLAADRLAGNAPETVVRIFA